MIPKPHPSTFAEKRIRSNRSLVRPAVRLSRRSWHMGKIVERGLRIIYKIGRCFFFLVFFETATNNARDVGRRIYCSHLASESVASHTMRMPYNRRAAGTQ